tara:strand:+ start:40777 stop:41631 length:855 start_codon:yes stop_codon:yes gene_type:complete
MATTICSTLLAAPAIAATTPDKGASWSPKSSERLVKLPSTYLKKAIDQDFSKSSLAAALTETSEEIRLKVKTLEDMRGAIERADGELRTELRHQYLAEKRAYLTLVASHQKMRERRAKTKIRVYQRLLRKMRRNKGAHTPQRVALIEKQSQARSRFEASAAKVDAKLFKSALLSESKYAREYARNVSAIEKLVEAINSHPMNEQAAVNGIAVSKEDFVRQLVGESEADLAVLDQERTVLGYMAKLVALDAMALTETLQADNAEYTEGEPDKKHVSEAVGFFLDR